jgi:hypothetical protein
MQINDKVKTKFGEIGVIVAEEKFGIFDWFVRIKLNEEQTKLCGKTELDEPYREYELMLID